MYLPPFCSFPSLTARKKARKEGRKERGNKKMIEWKEEGKERLNKMVRGKEGERGRGSKKIIRRKKERNKMEG